MMQLRIGRFFFLMALASAVATSQILGQQKTTVAPSTQQPAKTTKAGISGVVLDSVNSRSLSGAEVIIQGANISRITDSLGKFKVDSLPPGTYQVGVFHPLL
ncbi:MAG TPA: carboxypeptidase regulatory-like domain-containing protein, partial [Gemmatimonadaceae bacterium]|nr:carboxypeptidase regulatory-like domain-containing protein [Gemmatimonadaceae bacterium]